MTRFIISDNLHRQSFCRFDNGWRPDGQNFRSSEAQHSLAMNVEQNGAVPVAAEGRPPSKTDSSAHAKVSRDPLSLCEIKAGEYVWSYVPGAEHRWIAKIEKRVSASFGAADVDRSSNERHAMPEPNEVVRIEGLIPQTLQHLADRMLGRLGEIPDGCQVGNIEAARSLTGRLARRTEFRSARCFRIVREDAPDDGFRQSLS
jgi:hypothetical protein